MSLVGRLRDRLARGHDEPPPSQPPPALSVIVPFYGVEDYLADCLDSLLAQTFTDLEILLVDDGSRDGSRAIADRYAAEHPHVRVIDRPNGGLGAARNTGIREAVGEWLTFVDSDDVLPPKAFERLLETARRTGSDLVVGAPERFDSDGAWTPTWVEGVHDIPRLRTTARDFPAVLRNLYTWNKVYHRDFWQAQDLWFREGVAYEDQPIVTQLLARARTLDVIPDLVYRWRRREDRSSISQQRGTLRDLQHRIEAWDVSREVLLAEHPELYQDWLATLFEAHFIWYVGDPAVADDDFWELLQPTVQRLAAEATDDVWRATSPGQRVLVRLTMLGRRDDLLALTATDPTVPGPWPTETREDGLLVRLPGLDDPDLAESLFVRRPEQLTVAQSVDRLRFVANTLEVGGWAYLRTLDLGSGAPHRVVVEAVDQTGAVVAEVAAPAVRLAPTPAPYEDPIRDYARGRFDAHLPLDGLTETDSWTLWVRVESGALRARHPLSAGEARFTWPREVAHGGGRFVTEWRERWPLEVRFDPEPVPESETGDGPQVLVHDVERSGARAVVVRGRLVGGQGATLLIGSRHGTGWGELVPAPVVGDRFEVTIPLVWRSDLGGELALPTGMHGLRAVLHGEGVEPIEVMALPDKSYADSLPLALPDVPDRTQDVIVSWKSGGALRLNLRRPLGDLRSRFHQLRQAQPGERPVDGVLISNAHGAHTGDAAALAPVMRGLDADLPVYAGIRDLSAPVPSGVTGVLINSPQWHRLRGSIRCLVVDRPQPRVQASPPWQQVIQLLDDYPLLDVGAPEWSAGVMADDDSAAVLEAASRWDQVITPGDWADEVLHRDLGVTSRALGWPRHDRAGDADLRTQVRTALGISADQRVVLAIAREGDEPLPYARLAARLPADHVLMTTAPVAHLPLCCLARTPDPALAIAAADLALVGRTDVRLDAAAAGLPILLFGQGHAATLPGPRLSTADLLDSVADLWAPAQRAAGDWQRFRTTRLPHVDGGAARRLAELVLAAQQVHA